jgi:hypothetical protein
MKANAHFSSIIPPSGEPVVFVRNVDLSAAGVWEIPEFLKCQVFGNDAAGSGGS